VRVETIEQNRARRRENRPAAKLSKRRREQLERYRAEPPCLDFRPRPVLQNDKVVGKGKPRHRVFGVYVR
jgi:hypothetical protein